MSNISWKPRAGVEFVDGGLRINMDKFEPGMEPFSIERDDGVAHVSNLGIRIETHNGDIHWHWRDGQQESLLRRIKSVNIVEDLRITGTEQIELNHGSRLSWYLEPSGSIHVTFDAQGHVNEVSTFGVETMTSPDGELTVLSVLPNE